LRHPLATRCEPQACRSNGRRVDCPPIPF
jgi:hypothetical protein